MPAGRGDGVARRPQVGLAGVGQRLTLRTHFRQAGGHAVHVERGGDAEARGIALGVAPGVHMGVDQPGQQGLAGAVHHRQAVGDPGIGSHRFHHAVAHHHRGHAQVALAVEHPRAADGEAVALPPGGPVRVAAVAIACVALQRNRQAERPGQGGEGEDLRKSFHDPFLQQGHAAKISQRRRAAAAPARRTRPSPPPAPPGAATGCRPHHGPRPSSQPGPDDRPARPGPAG